MKKGFVSLSTILLFFTFQLLTSSCEKEVIKEVQVTDTLIIKDTVLTDFPKDTLAFLTGRTWRIQEIRILQNQQFYFYQYGGSDHTFDDEYIKFNTDGTGQYHADGVNDNLVWAFKGDTKTKIEYTLNRTTPLVVNWENMHYKKDSLIYSEYYIKNGTLKTQSAVVRIPEESR
ncbi:hypothetical protein [Flavihumibacter petaseus]|uniref:Uncharacterized protein n=1 Tax=Flavihumibacter petaseus NBRC 106054 TaxID=1220578 RepID=A0A0E9MUF2_9BACT|nr:hypothetical protein [Flavihumibacter petaseus]GAO41204.1 hypothetical protein FPE01S_01_02160 [Flavihumibacter petaseus NBRC 106054]